MIPTIKKLLDVLKKINTQTKKKLLSKFEFKHIEENIEHLIDDKEKLTTLISNKKDANFESQETVLEIIAYFHIAIVGIMGDIHNIKESVDVALERNRDYFNNKN